MKNPFGSKQTISTSLGEADYYSLTALDRAGLGDISRLPYLIKILLECLLRNCDGYAASESDVAGLVSWALGQGEARDVAFFPARVLLQDFTGVPAVVDLAAMRDAVVSLGGDPRSVNPLVPVDLVIDHSVQVDRFGTRTALSFNVDREFERNRERYEFLKWGQRAFDNFRLVPPATGICHQVNLENLARVVEIRQAQGRATAFPDSLVGTDSHTTMINGLGVVGWGVGGIEAEAVMLGQPIYLMAPHVVGVRLVGEPSPHVTATDVVLTVTQLLRKHGVVDRFVEFFGPGLSSLSLPDRATLANMAPEYGATVGFFPVDQTTIEYLRFTGRSDDLVDLVERYTREQGLYRTDDAPDPRYGDVLDLDLSAVEVSIAGPKRPQDRISLRGAKRALRSALPGGAGESSRPGTEQAAGEAVCERSLTDASVVIAAITSCTNTSNPPLMIGAGLLARRAVERGIGVRPWVKTSLAPGSRVASRYLESSGLLPYLEALRFHLVGYGCTTCIGNSGPLPDWVDREIRKRNLSVASVLSGNRNFEGRIHPRVKLNYLASPPLVVAYALAGTVDIDFEHEPLGCDPNGEPVYLRDLWPEDDEVGRIVKSAVGPRMFEDEYRAVFRGDRRWDAIAPREGDLYPWNLESTYIQEPPFFRDLTPEAPGIPSIRGARVLAVLGDSVTTDHISPAGDIDPGSPAGLYLRSRGVASEDFNSYGSRRGSHDVMVRGTFANVRFRNLLVPDLSGGMTLHLPRGEVLTIYEAAERYRREGVALVVLAGKDYGMGSSRDWAAKGTYLLGIRAVVAESFERIHRSNLVGMGVLPLQFREGESVRSLGLTGRELLDADGLEGDLRPGQEVFVSARAEDGSQKGFPVRLRVDTAVEMDYCRNGGILQTVLRTMSSR